MRSLDDEDRAETELDEELRFHFERSVEELMAGGLCRADAEAETHQRFGNLQQYRTKIEAIDRKRATSVRRVELFSVLIQNVRQALRGLRQSPGFGIAIILTLGLGIGANATMFGVIDRLLLKPPPHIRNPDNVRRLYVNRSFLDRSVTTASMTVPDLDDFARSKTFESAAFYPGQATLGRGEKGVRVRATMATASLFPLLGVQPVLGRFFDPAEDRVGVAGTVVLSHEFWRKTFGGDPDVIGEALQIASGTFTVIGVAPPGFTGTRLARVDVWVPLHTSVEHFFSSSRWLTSRGNYWIRVVARLKPDVTVEAAEAEATVLHRRGRADDSRYDENASITAAPLIAAQGPNAPRETAVARWLAGVSLIVLIIACANVANLLLGRGIRWRRETAIRLTLGISRARLVSQLLTETTMLALFGGIAAVVIAGWSGAVLRAMLAPNILWAESPVNTRVLIFTLVVALITGLLAGMIPALQATRPNLVSALKEGGWGTTLSRSRMRIAFLVAQGALTVVLLVSAGLFVRSLYNVRSLDLGLDPDGVLAVVPELESDRLEQEEIYDLYDRALDRIRAIPGVENVAASVSMPFMSSFAERLRVPGMDSLPVMSTGGPYVNPITEQYLEALGIRLLRGRGFTSSDSRAAPRVAVVNETMARTYWPGEDALGKCLLVGAGEPPCAEVIGIVRDPRRQELIEEPSVQYFVPLVQRMIDTRPEAIYLSSRRDLGQISVAVRKELLALSTEIRFVEIDALSDFVDPQARSWRLGATMFTIFGILALLIAAIGLYSVLAFNVAQRTHEIGVRAALGATSNRLITLIVREALLLTALGLALGTLISLVGGRAIAPLLYDVSPHDPLIFSLVTATLLAVGVLAGSVPAWRATRVDPNVALRAE